MLSASKPKSNDSKKVNILSKLPSELEIEVLSNLSFKSAANATCVNKEHAALGRDNFFWFSLFTYGKTGYNPNTNYKALAEAEKLRARLMVFITCLYRKYHQQQPPSRKGNFSLFLYELEKNLLEINPENNRILAGALFFTLREYRQQIGYPHYILLSSSPSGVFLNDIKNGRLIPEDVTGCLIAFYQYVNKLPGHGRNALGTNEQLLTQITGWLDKLSQTQALTPLIKKLG